MKQVALLVLLLIAGCGRKSQIADAPKPVPAKSPCAPNPAMEIQDGKIHAKITEKANTPNQSWSETHSASCEWNYRTVSPSRRELQRAEESGEVGDDVMKWLDEHELCEPDGLK